MMRAFTRNYEDNSSEAGFQFTFYCDICNDGYKSSFIESETYKRGKGLRGISQGLGMLGSLVGGVVGDIGYSAERGGHILSENFQGQSPEWHKEHERSFAMAQNEAQSHFHRCHSCNHYACDACYNEDEGLCTECAPRQEIYVAKARAEAMRRNINEAGELRPYGRDRSRARRPFVRRVVNRPATVSSAIIAVRPWISRPARTAGLRMRKPSVSVITAGRI